MKNISLHKFPERENKDEATKVIFILYCFVFFFFVFLLFFFLPAADVLDKNVLVWIFVRENVKRFFCFNVGMDCLLQAYNGIRICFCVMEMNRGLPQGTGLIGIDTFSATTPPVERFGLESYKNLGWREDISWTLIFMVHSASSPVIFPVFLLKYFLFDFLLLFIPFLSLLSCLFVCFCFPHGTLSIASVCRRKLKESFLVFISKVKHYFARLFLFLFLPSLALPAPTLFLSFYRFPPLTPPNLYDFSSFPYPPSFTPSFTFLPVKLTLLEMSPPHVDGYVTRTLISRSPWF